MPAGGLVLHRWASARELPDLEPDVGRGVSPDPPLHAVPEDAPEGVFKVSDVGDAGSSVLDAGPPSLADLTPGEQVETPPSRPRDDGLDPPGRFACHDRTPALPAPQAPGREAGRPQRDRDHDVHGRQQPAFQLRLPSNGLSMLPALVRPDARRVASGCRPGDGFLTRPGAARTSGVGGDVS